MSKIASAIPVLSACSLDIMDVSVISGSDRHKILVVEDHPTTLSGIHSILKRFSDGTDITTTYTLQDTLETVRQSLPDLIILDLQIPRIEGENASTEVGIQLLKALMQKHPRINIAIHSSYPDALVRIIPDIDNHQGGFTVTNKDSSTEKAFERFSSAMNGYTHTRDIRGVQAGLELKSEWLTTLDLACSRGLQDRAIAKHLHVSESMVRNYWSKIYDVLSVLPEEEKEEGRNLRVVTCNRAREEGLID